MADRSTRSSSQRTTPLLSPKPPHSRNKPSPNLSLPQQSTRVTRSRSHEIHDADVREPVIKLNRRKVAPAPTHNEKNVAKNGAQANRVGKKGARSEVLPDLPAITEDLRVIDTHLPPDEAGEVDSPGDESTGRRGHTQQKTKPLGDSSAISGSTARNSYSAQDLARPNPRDKFRKGAIKKAAAAYDPRDISATEHSAVETHNDDPSAFTSTTGGQGQLKGSAPKSTRSRTSNIPFDSLKYIQSAAKHLVRRREREESATGLLPQQDDEEEENTHAAQSTAMAGTAVRKTTRTREPREMDVQVSMNPRLQSALDPHQEGDDTWLPQGFGEDEVLATSDRESLPDPVARGRQVLELQASRDAENNKENIYADQPIRVKKHFIDPQHNAERISFESQEPTLPVLGNDDQRLLPRRVSTEERDLLEESDEVSADEGFQQDQRPISLQPRRDRSSPKKRSAPAPPVSRRSAKRVQPAPRDESPTDEIGTAVARHNRDQIPAPSQLENYKKANTQAKLMTSRQLKEPQKRKAWTDEETKQLIALIEEHGTSWKLLKELDQADRSILASRDQVALKDKARNMKIDFLKAGTYMPQNFDKIPLSKSQIDKLRSRGIIYEVAEKDQDDG